MLFSAGSIRLDTGLQRPYRSPHREWERDVAKKTVIGKKRALKKAPPQKKSTAGALKKVGPRKSGKVLLPKGPVWQWSAVETAAAIRSGAISSVEVIDAHIGRMRAV